MLKNRLQAPPELWLASGLSAGKFRGAPGIARMQVSCGKPCAASAQVSLKKGSCEKIRTTISRNFFTASGGKVRNVKEGFTELSQGPKPGHDNPRAVSAKPLSPFVKGDLTGRPLGTFDNTAADGYVERLDE